MQDEHRRAIQNNFASLVEQTDLDHMVSALYEKGVFSEQMIEPYKDLTKDARSRKRLLYRDITRRGPDAFRNLLDALSDAGYWDLVRDLDPNSSLHTRRTKISAPSTSSMSNENDYVSISTEKKKTKPRLDVYKNDSTPIAKDTTDLNMVPQYNVIKSNKFFEDGEDIKLYNTRGHKRGIIVVFSYIEFVNNIETYRKGVDVDCQKLKYLFSEMGFRVISYKNLTRDETVTTLESLKKVIVGVECVFIVVSSHGYERKYSSDTDIRCKDGQLITIYEIIDYFNNKNFPALHGIPKVFIFQLCRGSNVEYIDGPIRFVSPDDPNPPAERDGNPTTDTGRFSQDTPRTPLNKRNRLFSDILIAHSTLPGNVSYRDPEEGSWYIQTLCEVFAARAHDCHVDKLFTLVDKHLHERFHIQTSSVDKWGFNKRLYLHPGLYQD
ncbi:caspase Dronc isoform X3 [Pieris brassicae]|uniref:Caspase n=1 Tax=Pieris brassicae TaxID=7116 RepID=A0A9P0SLC5_PIEBR|nr:caspase Dronc isoform X3 [Pieris brassicae]CAH3879511.1 unnamed protein product [Pieris brassicae]